jgi:AcrR family transcriptional regulator
MTAARSVFAEQGLDASIHEVARAAGCGVGTIYRHFPAKDALIESLLVDRTEELIEFIEQVRRTEPRPWEAFVEVIRTVALASVDDRSLLRVMREESFRSALLDERQQVLLGLYSELMQAAQAEGSMRRDVGQGDLRLLFGTIAGAIGARGGDARTHARRCIGIVLDGLRAPGAEVLPGEPPSLLDAARELTGGAKPQPLSQ